MSAVPMSLLRAMSPDPEADLLGHYVATRDDAAFAALVRRYGPMVLGVCRRRLGHGPDADDAFQVTFMVLARDASRIANRAALPGWLHRVASLAALKLAGKMARRPEPLPEFDLSGREPEPADVVGNREFFRAVDEELAALPEKLRAVVLLCGLDEKTNREAARVLGCPTGTVDSRLSAARQRLATRLARRGFPVASAAGVALRPPNVSAGQIAHAVRSATAYTVGSASPDPLSTIADGVTSTMGTAKLKLMVLSGLALATFGSAGLGMFAAPTDDGQGAKSPAKEAKADPQKKPAEPPKKPAENAHPLLADEAAVRTVLSQPVGNLEEAMSLRELCDYLHDVYGINARLDTLAFKRLGNEDDTNNPQEVLQYYDVKIMLPITRGLTVADLLNEAAAQLPGHVGVRFRGNQVLLGPAYKPPYTPGARSNDANEAPFVSGKTLMEQIVGEPVSIAVDEKPFAEVLKDLRKLTGANIVVDSRCKDKTKLAVSGTFSDVRLLTVMTILADMCEMKPVWNNNVYYVTTPENAARIQKDVNKELFGEPTLAVPAGYVTDGLHLYSKPADLKLADMGLGGLGGLPFRAVPAPAPEKK